MRRWSRHLRLSRQEPRGSLDTQEHLNEMEVQAGCSLEAVSTQSTGAVVKYILFQNMVNTRGIPQDGLQLYF